MNPLDQKLRDYNLLNVGANLPIVLGGDIVGIVVKSGTNTSEFPIGTHVFSRCADIGDGSLQEYSLVDARYTARVPEAMSDEDAAVFPINGVTAAVSLFEPSRGLGIPFPGTAESKTFDYKSQTLVVVGGGTNLWEICHTAGSHRWNWNHHHDGLAL